MAAGLEARFERCFDGGPSVAADFDAPPAAVTVLFGPSGAGKTTVLRCVAGLERPQRGTITLDGDLWCDADARVHVPPQRRGVGLMAQDYALFPHLSVEQNVGYGLHAWPREDAAARMDELLRLLRLEGLRARRPAALSGGEQQRAALARALAPRPRLLLLDEPLSALDAPTRDELRLELRRVLRTQGVPVLLVTHDRLEALALGDRMVVLSAGRVLQRGPVPEVFGRPADREVARLVGVETVLAARVESRSEGLALVESAGLRLTALDPGGDASEVFACLRAEDVLLQHGSAPASSARNRLAGRVTSLVPEGALVRVGLDCGGLLLVALVTRHAAEELALAPGAPVDALVKATAIHLVPR